MGARDLAECLKLQLVRRTPVNELAVRIVERHLDALSKSRYGLIARELKVPQTSVMQDREGMYIITGETKMGGNA